MVYHCPYTCHTKHGCSSVYFSYTEQYLVLATMYVILKNHDINNVEQAGPSVNISHFDTSSYYAGVDYDYR